MKIYILVTVLISSQFITAQSQNLDSIASSESVSRKYVLKLRVLSSIEMIINYNRQIVGLEFEKKLKESTSLVVDLDVGYFDNYIYIKYYDFFQNTLQLPYTETKVKTKGFHISPNYRYYAMKFGKRHLSGLHIGGAMDFHYYVRDYNYYDSRTEFSSSHDYSSGGIALGGVGGIQYMIKNRWVVDASISIYYNVLSFTTEGRDDIKSRNSFWVSDNGKFWALYRLKIGYAFGE